MIAKMVTPNETPEKQPNISDAIRISLNEENEEEVNSEKSNDESYNLSASSTNWSSAEEKEKSSQKKKKDILHRDIEKRRRERINRSLVKLRELIPTTKGSMKCSSRLQKAKLLEMTVDYLASMANDKTKTETSPSKNQEKIQQTYPTEKANSPQRTVIAESAKEIYMTGYKAATENILKKLSVHFNITGANLNDLRENVNIMTSEVSVPNMLLVPPSPCDDGKDLCTEIHDDNKPTTIGNLTESKIDDNCPGSPIFQPAKKEYKINNCVNENYDEQDEKSKSTSSSTSSGFCDESSEILISCLIKDPITLQYDTSLLPLDLILSPERRSMSQAYLQKQSKLTMKNVMGIHKQPSNQPKTYQPQKYPDQKHLQIPTYPTTSAMPLLNNKHSPVYSNLKRKFPEERQVPVITNQLKRPPSLLPGYMINQQVSTNPHVPMSPIPSSESGKVMSDAPYYRDIGMRYENKQQMQGLCNKNIQSMEMDSRRGRLRDWTMKDECW